MNAVVKEIPEKAAPEIVEMSDGRKVSFPPKRKTQKEVIIDRKLNKVSVRFDFRNGETYLFAVPHDLILEFAGHGASQKLGDETATTDKEVTTEDLVLWVTELGERLTDTKLSLDDRWTSRRESGGFAGTSILLKALVEKSGKTVEVMRGWLKGKTQQEKMALRAHPTLKQIVERLEAEKVSKGAKIDTDSLLDEIM